MDIIKKEYIFLDIEVNNQKEAFSFFAKKAAEFGIVNDEKSLIKGFEDREQESSTGFEEGFAIPHARIPEVKKAAVFFARFKKGIDWKSMDGNPTNVAIALIVPKGPSGDEHISILSNVATKLMDKKFKNIAKTSNNEQEIVEQLVEEQQPQKITNNNDDKKLNIVGITACVVGIAHTYMAEQKLLEMGQKLGHNIRVETQGSKGVGNKLTSKEIDEADVVILATDTAVDTSRFVGKKVYSVKVAEAIKDPAKIINQSMKLGSILVGNNKNNSFNTKNVNNEKNGVMQHILSGISYMIPVIIMGGICLAFSLGVAKAVWGPGASPDHDGLAKWGPLNILNIIGGAAFGLMIPVLAGFIANSVAGRSAIAPAMVSAWIANQAGTMNADGKIENLGNLMPWISGMDVVQTPLGFIGAIIAGLGVGYFVKWINTWRVPKALAPAMPIFFVPLVAGIGMSLIFIYIIGAPIGWVMQQVQDGIKKAYSGDIGFGVGIGLGFILGAMAGFDMGGPVNKIAFVTCSMLVTMKIYEPMGAMAAGIPVAPLGMGLTTIFFPRFFNKDEKGVGVAAIIMGSIGISEGAIPFAIRDPKRAIVCNVAGSAVASAIAGALMVTNSAAHGGPIVAILGAVPYGKETAYFFLAIFCGVVVNTLMYGLWLTKDAGAYGSIKEAHVAKINEYISDRNEKIDELKTQIKLAKQEKNTLKANSLKEQIYKEKHICKSLISEAKNAYKSTYKLESQLIKENKTNIKNEISKINFEYKQKIAEAKIELKKAQNKKDTSKIQEKENIINEIFEDKQSAIIKYNQQLRKDCREKYLSLIK
ncbi:fructose-specific PTS transporter subunit EIIC [Spiroplasma endosymbiont of Crioceris asparagi]|uniref:PTS fructose transporter subunit IIABC n=1 Tax=Spiroplasma endosymbiont of Crioceris asparagi TaxID=3066286 RepID=UPI0030CF906F